jgi:hypothetical protein
MVLRADYCHLQDSFNRLILRFVDLQVRIQERYSNFQIVRLTNRGSVSEMKITSLREVGMEKGVTKMVTRKGCGKFDYIMLNSF